MKFKLARAKLPVAVILFICLIPIVLFLNPLLHPNNILYFSDVIHVWYFFKLFAAKCIQKYGELPLWNPLIYSGVPFVGNPQSTMFYPLFAIFYFIPVHYAVTLTYAIHYVIAGLGMYFFARSKQISYAGSLFGAIIFMLNWKLFGHTFAGHMSIICTYSYTPWFFIAMERLVKKQNFRSLAFAAGCLSLSFLCGSPQIFYYQFLIGFAYFACLVFQSGKKQAVKPAVLFCGVFILFLLISAIFLLPVYEVMCHSQREGGTKYLFAVSYSLKWSELITLLFPRFFVNPQPGSNIPNGFFWETAVYLGLSPLFFALASFKSELKKTFYFFAGLFGVTLIFSLGGTTPFFKIFYYLVPGIKFFRCPARMFLFGAFAVSVLAPIGLDYITRNRAGAGLPAKVAFALLATLSAVWTVSYFIYDYPISGGLYAMVITAILGTLFFGFATSKINANLFAGLIIFVSLADYFGLSYPLVKSVPVHQIKPKGRIYENLTGGNYSYRVLDLTRAFPQFVSAELWTHQLGSCDGVMIDKYLEYIIAFYNNLPYPNNYKIKQTFDSFPFGNVEGNVNWKLIDLLNTKYVITSYPLKESFLIEQGSYFSYEFNTRYLEGLYPLMYLYPQKYPQIKTYLYLNKNCIERAYLLLNPRAGKNPDTLLDSFIEGAGNNAVLPVKITRYTPNSIEISVQTPVDAYLVTSEIDYPGWSVKINGKKDKILVVKNIFRAVALPEGKHRILFEYKPSSFFYGMAISILGLLILTAGLVFEVLGKKQTAISGRQGN